jgi:hypothetical protein
MGIESVLADPFPNPVNLKFAIGRLAVTVVSPLEAKEPVKAVAISDKVLLWVVELMVVPVTTGFPLGRL